SMVQMQYVPAWSIDGLPVTTLPAGLNVRWCLAPCTLGAIADEGPQMGSYSVAATGWMVFDVQVTAENLPCANDTLLFHALDSIYIHLFPPLPLTVQLTGPAVVCDGDTVLLTATCTGCDSLAWWSSGAGQQVGEDSFEAWAAGQFTVTAMATDTN